MSLRDASSAGAVSSSLRTDLALDALEQALYARPAKISSCITATGARSKRARSVTADRLADAGIDPSVGSIGDSYDNALAESVTRAATRPNDPSSWSVAAPRGSRVCDLEWVDWFNHRRLLARDRSRAAGGV